MESASEAERCGGCSGRGKCWLRQGNLDEEDAPRICSNSWVTHNFEGFFMNIEDMLVKSGGWQNTLLQGHFLK
jgi:hypothetical protein